MQIADSWHSPWQDGLARLIHVSTSLWHRLELNINCASLTATAFENLMFQQPRYVQLTASCNATVLHHTDIAYAQQHTVALLMLMCNVKNVVVCGSLDHSSNSEADQ